MDTLNDRDILDYTGEEPHKYCKYCYHGMYIDSSYWQCPGCEHREEISGENKITPSGKTQLTDWVNSI